jgi:hypothetical protein
MSLSFADINVYKLYFSVFPLYLFALFDRHLVVAGSLALDVFILLLYTVQGGL